MNAPVLLATLAAEDAQRLSRVFNAGADLRLSQDERINEWLKSLIRFTSRCTLCHGSKTVNFEQANGWDEPCLRCAIQDAPNPDEGASMRHEGELRDAHNSVATKTEDR